LVRARKRGGVEKQKRGVEVERASFQTKRGKTLCRGKAKFPWERWGKCIAKLEKKGGGNEKDSLIKLI